MTSRARQPLLIAILVCAAFTSVASGVVLVLDLSGHVDGTAPFTLGLLVRMVLFGAAAGIALTALLRSMRDTPSPVHEDAPVDWRLMLIPCAVAAAIALPRLGATPHVEPDEWHHLNVARNLAEHGLYASGSPDTGFVMFDDYDSVGPPVIVPVAAAMRAFGSELETARLVMAMFFVALAAVVFAVVAPIFGSWAGICSAVLLAGAWGTAYLGRTLYGEVPALLFWLLAMIIARASLRNGKTWRWAALAGICFGLAVLTKYYILMTVWPLLGVVLLDRFGPKRIDLRHLTAGAAGSVATIGAWPLVQSFAAQDVTSASSGRLSMYQHNLLFGMEGVGSTAGFLFQQPSAFIALIAALGFGWWTVNRYRRDPAFAAIWFLAAFQWFWWIFFNTGNLPRYSWYGWAAAAILLGPFVVKLTVEIRDASGRPMLIRAAAAAACIALVIPSLRQLGYESSRAWRADEMAPTRELASYVATRPERDRVGSAFWPLERSVPYLSGRTVERIRDQKEAANYDVVLVHAQLEPQWLEGGNAKRFGPYAAVHK
jgi:hypothetical protein